MHELVVLISGRGSNLSAISRAIKRGEVNARIVNVISNRRDTAGLELARQLGHPTALVDQSDYTSTEDFHAALLDALNQHPHAIIALAGFMRLLPPSITRAFADRLINIHPSLLPKYPGLDTHQRALQAGDTIHGCTTHFVTDELDAGPPIMQARLDIAPEDDAQSLAARVLELEHKIYPKTLQLFCQGRIALVDGACIFEQTKLTHALAWEDFALETSVL